MRLAGTVLAIILSVGLASGQEFIQPTQPSGSSVNELCTVEGVVVKATTGEALKKITVSINPLAEGREPRSATTDTSGRFAFTGLEPGRYMLSASGNGYSQQIYGQRKGSSAGKVFTLTPGSHEKDLAFRLMPLAAITGTVYDEDGDPVLNANVQIIRLSRPGSHSQMYPVGGAQTNDLGQYRIFGLEPGRYLVCATLRQQNRLPDSSDETYLPTFYPNASDPGQATPISVQPGDDISGIDVDMRLVHAVLVSGQVICAGVSKSLQGVYVSMEPRETSSGGFPYTNYGGPVRDAKGNFEIPGVPPGAYWMSAGWYDENRSYSGRAAVEVGNSNLDNVTLVIGPALQLRGRVRTRSDGELNFTNLNVWLQSIDSSMGGAAAQVNADGTFVLENVPEGTFRPRIGGFPEEFYVESVRAGGSDVLGPGLTVTRGQPMGSLEIVLSRDGGSVEGTVLHDQNPFGGALVVLVPDPPNRNRDELYSFKTADPLGRFSLLGLPPGDFKLFAWEPREGLEFNDPDLIKDYEDRGTRVHIEARQHQNVQLPVIPSEESAP